MKRTSILMLIAASLLTGCLVAPARHGHHAEGIVIVPVLPSVVVLEAEPYYYYEGFHYHYVDGRWLYSKSKNGPWIELPRDHYPKEVRYKGKGRGRDHGRGHDHRDDDRHRWD